MTATKKKMPPTSALLDQKPPALSCACAATVVATIGGAVGVTVKVSICPVTVITETYGVGVHVELGDELFVLTVGDGGDVVGVVGIEGVEIDNVVDGLSIVVETGITKGVVAIFVLVDVVEGVCTLCISQLIFRIHTKAT